MARRKAVLCPLGAVLFFASACATMPPAVQTPPPSPMLRPVSLAPLNFALPMAVTLEPVRVRLPPPTDAPSLRARYGPPDFVRRETDTELWRYDGDNCAVFFFLYREGGVLKLRYSETTPRGMEAAADPACVESLNAHPGAMS